MQLDLKNKWYSEGLDYWNKQHATNDGVLGGYGKVHKTDSITSNAMI